jgi:hypothetical protein
VTRGRLAVIAVTACCDVRHSFLRFYRHRVETGGILPCKGTMIAVRFRSLLSSRICRAVEILVTPMDALIFVDISSRRTGPGTGNHGQRPRSCRCRFNNLKRCTLPVIDTCQILSSCRSAGCNNCSVNSERRAIL